VTSNHKDKPRDDARPVLESWSAGLIYDHGHEDWLSEANDEREIPLAGSVPDSLRSPDRA
jgi:hypothetical protein